MVHLGGNEKQPIDFVSCATSILNLGRPIAEIWDTLLLSRREDTFGIHTKSAVEKAEKWVKDAERNCGMNLDRSRVTLSKIKDAVRRKDLPDGIRTYEEFKTSVYQDVGGWAEVATVPRPEFSSSEPTTERRQKFIEGLNEAVTDEISAETMYDKLAREALALDYSEEAVKLRGISADEHGHWVILDKMLRSLPRRE